MDELSLRNALIFPFDMNVILTKHAVLKNELENSGCISKRIAILGESTTAQLRNNLELFLLNRGIKPTFYESDFAQGRQDVLALKQELLDFNPELIFIHSNYFNIKKWPKVADSKETVDQLANEEYQSFRIIWERIIDSIKCPIIQNNFEPPPFRTLGNLDVVHHSGRVHYIQSLNSQFAKFAQEVPNFYINDIGYQSSLLGLDKWYDFNLWYRSKYAMSFHAIATISHNVANIASSIWGTAKRCLVLDLDNTLWGGVIGEDGLAGIGLGPDTIKGEVFQDFQAYVKTLHDRGVQLAIASKNNESTAKTGFEHPHSVLKWEDFASIKANWNPKVDSIREISNEMNLRLESLVFMDDNPAEREIVLKFLPNVVTPALEKSATKYFMNIDRQGFFEATSLISEDLSRGDYYKQNLMRSNYQLNFASYLEYLLSLEMKASIEPFKTDNLTRINQLIHKTNQFNLTTLRYSSSDSETMLGADKFITASGRLIDRFGDNGIVALIVGQITGDLCEVTLNLMSCRVLNRNLEFAMLDYFFKQCKAKGIVMVRASYIESGQNQIAENLYKNAGFSEVEKVEKTTYWELATNKYELKNKCIEVNDRGI
jgi:FkbH-like protein